MRSLKMNIELMKQFNKTSVLRIIRKEAPISRVEIANRMELSRPSVSEIVFELIEEGWVRELAGTKIGPGRRPIPLEINPANLINLFNPSFLILGGGVIEVGGNIYPVGAATLIMEEVLES